MSLVDLKFYLSDISSGYFLRTTVNFFLLKMAV